MGCLKTKTQGCRGVKRAHFQNGHPDASKGKSICFTEPHVPDRKPGREGIRMRRDRSGGAGGEKPMQKDTQILAIRLTRAACSWITGSTRLRAVRQTMPPGNRAPRSFAGTALPLARLWDLPERAERAFFTTTSPLSATL